MHLPTKTSSPNEKKGKRKKTAETGDKKSPKKGKLEPHVENDGCRTPERQGNLDLENNNPPAPPAVQREELSITEENRQEIQRSFRNIDDIC